MLYLTAGADAYTRPTALAPCPGRRDENWTPCANGCVGHHDRYAGSDEPHSANDVLYWVPRLAGAECVNAWTWHSHPCMTDERLIRLVRHPDLLMTDKDVAVPVWVLIVDNHQFDEQSYALAFTDAGRASEAFAHEVEEAEGDCDC